MAKLCPLLAVAVAAAGEMTEENGGENVPPKRAPWARCVGRECAWWDQESGECAVLAFLHLQREELIEILREQEWPEGL